MYKNHKKEAWCIKHRPGDERFVRFNIDKTKRFNGARAHANTSIGELLDIWCVQPKSLEERFFTP